MIVIGNPSIYKGRVVAGHTDNYLIYHPEGRIDSWAIQMMKPVDGRPIFYIGISQGSGTRPNTIPCDTPEEVCQWIDNNATCDKEN